MDLPELFWTSMIINSPDPVTALRQYREDQAFRADYQSCFVLSDEGLTAAQQAANNDYENRLIAAAEAWEMEHEETARLGGLDEDMALWDIEALEAAMEVVPSVEDLKPKEKDKKQKKKKKSKKKGRKAKKRKRKNKKKGRRR